MRCESQRLSSCRCAITSVTTRNSLYDGHQKKRCDPWRMHMPRLCNESAGAVFLRTVEQRNLNTPVLGFRHRHTAPTDKCTVRCNTQGCCNIPPLTVPYDPLNNATRGRGRTRGSRGLTCRILRTRKRTFTLGTVPFGCAFSTIAPVRAVVRTTSRSLLHRLLRLLLRGSWLLSGSCRLPKS